MSTNPEDELVTLISRWLAGHVDDEELEAGLKTDGLSEELAEAVKELGAELGKPGHARGQVQMLARETLEALAFGL